MELSSAASVLFLHAVYIPQQVTIFYASTILYNRNLHPPEGRLAPISPVVLWRAVRAAVLVAVVPSQADPEVAIGWTQLCDQLLHHLLLRFGLDAEQLPSVSSAGQICLHKVQPPPELGEVGQLVAGFAFPCLAHPLACNHNPRPVTVTFH